MQASFDSQTQNWDHGRKISVLLKYFYISCIFLHTGFIFSWQNSNFLTCHPSGWNIFIKVMPRELCYFILCIANAINKMIQKYFLTFIFICIIQNIFILCSDSDIWFLLKKWAFWNGLYHKSLSCYLFVGFFKEYATNAF